MRSGPGHIEIICPHGCGAQLEVPMPDPDVGNHFTDAHYIAIGQAVAGALVAHAIFACVDALREESPTELPEEPDVTCGRCGNPMSAHGNKPQDSPPGCGWTKAMVRDHYEDWWGSAT